GVVLKRLRGAEGRHHRLPCELLDRAACCLDLGGHRVVEALEACAGALRILLAGERRRASEIGEEDRGQLPLLGHVRSVAYTWRPCSTPCQTGSKEPSATSAAAASSTRRRSRRPCARSGSRCSRPTSTSRSSRTSSHTSASARSARRS